MIKDLFSGSLGKLNNHGGSRIYTTPNTILVPPEYEVDIGKHGDFVSCTLDGRLWLFKDKIIALKWNEGTGRMEFSASRNYNNDVFIQRGIDWILTAKYIIQYNDGKIVVEVHKIKNLQPMEKFYSLLPALDGFQIIKGYLIRKPGAEHTDLVYRLKKDENVFLIPRSNQIWGKNSDYVGQVTLRDFNDYFELDIGSLYAVSDNITGISFLGDDVYGFQVEENNQYLYYSSQNLNLFSFYQNVWETFSEETGKIYFDMFNQKAIVFYEKGIELLPQKTIIQCDGLPQWITPTENKEIYYVSNNNIISALNGKVLETNLFCKYYRNLLQNSKELPISATAYTSRANNKYQILKLAVGNTDNKLNFNSMNTIQVQKYADYDIEVKLLNVFEHEINYTHIPHIYKPQDGEDEKYCGSSNLLNYQEGIECKIPLFISNYISENDGYYYWDNIYSDVEWVLWSGDWELRGKNLKIENVFGYPFLDHYFTNNEDASALYITRGWNYFYINLNTGKYQDKAYSITHSYKISDCGGDSELSYISEYFSGLWPFIYEENYNWIYSGQKTISIANPPFKNEMPVTRDMSYEDIDIFTDGWKLAFDYSDLTMMIMSSEYYVFSNNIITFNNGKANYILTDEQKALLEKYTDENSFLKHSFSYDYYNKNKKDEFAHIVCFLLTKEESYNKALFFVFRTKLIPKEFN